MRDYAMLHLSIWTDDAYRALGRDEQWLYKVLLTSLTLNHAGVADWRPKRIAQLAAGTTAADVERAGAGLAAARFVVIDEDTEEVLVRTFVRWDGLLKQPNMGVAAAKAWAGIASKTLRGVFVHEMRRLREDQADLKAWTHPSSKARLDEVLAADAVDPADVVPWTPSATPLPNPSPKGSENPSVDPSGNPSVDPSVDPSGKGSPKGLAKGCLTPSPSPTPNSSSPQPFGIANAIPRAERASNGRKTSKSTRQVTVEDALDGLPEPETNATAAGKLIAAWIDTLDQRPPGRVVGQIATQVKALLLDGTAEADVLLALDEWQMTAATKSVSPSVLPNIVHGIVSRRTAPTRQGHLPSPGGRLGGLSDAELRDRALNPHLYPQTAAERPEQVPA